MISIPVFGDTVFGDAVFGDAVCSGAVQGKAASRRAHTTPKARCFAMLVVMALLACFTLSARSTTANAAEFITPKGLNIEAQESMLKERVNRMAEELVGDKLVDVVVNIGYLRTDEKAEASRVKLPGFNHYIRPGEGQGDIISAHTRLRQIVVMVKDSVSSEPEAIEQEIRVMGDFKSDQGDLVRVITVSGQVKGKGENGNAMAAKEEKEDKAAGEEKDSDDLAKRMAEEKARQAEEARGRGLGMMMAKASLEEAQSTMTLIKARQAFFRGDLDRALDQILQSIGQNPNNPQAYAMLGSLYYAVDWKNLAVKYWEKSLTLDPENTDLEDLINKVRFKVN